MEKLFVLGGVFASPKRLGVWRVSICLKQLFRRLRKPKDPLEPDELRKNVLSELEQRIGYRFKNKLLLNEALAHRSYVRQRKLPANRGCDRLAFLGDAILDFLVGELVFQRLPDGDEGVLTRARSFVVSDESVSKAAKELRLHRFLLTGKSLRSAETPQILSTAFEALVAAIYLDGGLEAARGFVHKALGSVVEESLERGGWVDHKSKLQILAQKRFGRIPEYRVVSEEGPPHQRVFTVGVWVGGKLLGVGRGRSKKEAEQGAAEEALKHKELW